ncbi:MAG: hypothetical protein K1X89_27640 [Myxococcaceae bacterium]|nr:hypothetical protein [Myxococcaceae bacterium]
MIRTWLKLAFGVALIAAPACMCGPDGTGGAGSGSGGSGGSSASGGAGASGGSGGSTASGGGTSSSGGSGFNPDASCATETSMATLGRKPVDIIFVIDNSGSMTEEITGVEKNINANFAAIIGDAGVDYRVIMLSKNGSATQTQSICITPPLSGNATCTPPPAKPTNGPRFFQYDTEISSTNSLQKIIQTYKVADPSGAAPGGWSDWLRPEALKAFVEITDDQSAMTAANFETQLFALTPAQFGTAANRNYVFHSITGVPLKPNPTDAYQPSEPAIASNSKCSSAVNSGPQYGDLSKLTGGLRFPVCVPDNFSTVFAALGSNVVASAQLACDFAVPAPPQGFTLSNKIIVEYTPASGPLQSFSQVANAGACGASSFYVANGRVVICPMACTSVRANPGGSIAVRFTCEQGGLG